MLRSEQQAHVNCLREKIFEVDKYPHFNLLIDMMVDLSFVFDNDHVISLERTKLYGGYSLFGPLFRNFTAIDLTQGETTPYNDWVLNEERFIPNTRYKFESIPTSISGKLVCIPNLVHHYPNPRELIHNAKKLLVQGGTAMVFEPLVREVHQAPHDYFRITPNGMIDLFDLAGFNDIRCEMTGGPFEVLSYVSRQCLQYIPEEETLLRREFEIIASNIPPLDKQFTKNLVKESTFPMAYVVMGTK